MKNKLFRALRLIWDIAPGSTVATFAFAGAQSVLPLASLYYLKLAIDLLTVSHGTWSHDVAFRLGWFVALSGIFYLVHLATRLIGTYVAESLSLHVIEKTQEMIAAKSTSVDLSYYEDSKYFDTLHQAQREAPYRLGRLMGALSQVMQSAASFLAIGGLLLFSLHWTITLTAGAITATAVWLRSRNSRQLYIWQRAQAQTERQVAYYEWLLSSSATAKESRLFDLGRLFADRAATARRRMRDERLGFTRRRLLGEGLTQSAAATAATAVVAQMAFQALRGLLTVGDVVLNYQVFQRGVAALQEFGAGLASVHESNLFVSRLFEFLDLPQPAANRSAAVRFPVPLRSGVEFEDVSFSYPTATTKILDRVSFKIEPGQMIALVGENGAGKSTLVKLLCGLYEPTAGRITVDGIDIRSMDRQELWSAISVVFQDYGQYCVSAEENIWFGDIARGLDGDRIREAAAQTGADSVVAGLDRGYEQQLGILIEGGQELSIGQWQKIALARAFYRDTPLIVLDEPSSALDVRAEHAVFEQFKTLTTGRTSIIISHRLSTVRMADRIFVLENGRLIEDGSHDELMTTKGAYAELFETQASAYR